MIPICKHCETCKVNRPRGLCWACYYKPGVKDMYPSTSKYARRGVGNFTGNAPIAPMPTSYAPGTPEKMAVLEERARNRQALWHPLDAKHESDNRPGEVNTTMEQPRMELLAA
jgi:hypothetical protein